MVSFFVRSCRHSRSRCYSRQVLTLEVGLKRIIDLGRNRKGLAEGAAGAVLIFIVTMKIKGAAPISGETALFRLAQRLAGMPTATALGAATGKIVSTVGTSTFVARRSAVNAFFFADVCILDVRKSFVMKK